MVKALQAVRGMNDVLPDKIGYWQYVENIIRQVTLAYDYAEIRLPIVESTDLFRRSVGEVTDIVEKEMYTFDDRNGDSLTLRPEGTAVCARAGIQHGLLYNQIRRLWYMGPMFRHERPQKGRYRQFYQLGVEAFGMAGAQIDVELIAMNARLWQQLGLQDKLTLQINTLGSTQERAQYRDALRDYYSAHHAALDADSQRRLDSNPLRILDSKNPEMQALNAGAPKLLDYLGAESQAHFKQVQGLLTALDIAYEVNPRLVRGLDYYCHMVFEWVTQELGAQGTVSAGGRYDGLVEQLGGKATPACGFAVGIERIVALLQKQVANTNVLQAPHAYMVTFGDAAQQAGLALAEQLRHALPALSLRVDCSGGSFKNQLKRADKSGAQWVLIIGDDEVAQQAVALKFLRDEKPQQVLKQSELASQLQQLM